MKVNEVIQIFSFLKLFSHGSKTQSNKKETIFWSVLDFNLVTETVLLDSAKWKLFFMKMNSDIEINSCLVMILLIQTT